MIIKSKSFIDGTISNIPKDAYLQFQNWLAAKKLQKEQLEGVQVNPVIV